jgi:uncharacterized protein YbjT (DUF2867 family)
VDDLTRSLQDIEPPVFQGGRHAHRRHRGSGLIGSRLVARLAAAGHDAVAASPSTGVNTLTGQGLAEVMAGTDVVVDVSNSPSFADEDVLYFFRTSTGTLLAAERAAGVDHHVALSIVGADRMLGSGYMGAKVAQEELIRGGGVPWTVLRATQFFEFLAGIVAMGTDGDIVRLSDALLQPVAADDVVEVLADVATGRPVGGIVELGGPEALPIAEFGRRWLRNRNDQREVVTDHSVGYFGAVVDDTSLIPGPDTRLGHIRFADWLTTPAAQR